MTEHALQTAAGRFAPAARGRRIGDLYFTGAQAALDERGAVRFPGDVRAQADAVLSRLAELLEEAGGSLGDVVSLMSFHADPRDVETVFDVARSHFDGDYPAWTPMGFIGCQHPGALVVARAVAHLGDGARECIVPTTQPWRRTHPLSAACKKGELVFLAGHDALDEAGAVPQPLDHCGQARTAYARLGETLALAGGGLDDILDFTSFHVDIRGAHLSRDEVYNPEIIGFDIASRDAPTTSHVGATGLVRSGVLGTYSAIADLTPGPRRGADPDGIRWDARSPIATATRKAGGRLITVSGLVAAERSRARAKVGDVAGQVRHILGEMRASMEALGLTMAAVSEVVSFHKDPRTFDVVMDVASEFFDRATPPAWSFVGSPGLWFEEFQCEIAALAVAD